MPSEFETYLRRYLNDNGLLWSSSQIERWASDGEKELCKTAPMVIVRTVLPVTAGVPVYDFPPADFPYPSLGISQITYKGDGLIPLSQARRREYFPEDVLSGYTSPIRGAFSSTAFYNTAFFCNVASIQTTVNGETGTPEFWAFSGESENSIQLLPTPNETLSHDNTTLKFGPADIAAKCIVEYRTFQIPVEWQRPFQRLVRVLIKDYVLARAFELPGKGQQTAVAKYLNSRFKAKLEIYKQLFSGTFVANVNALGGNATSSGPVNPNFGNVGRLVR